MQAAIACLVVADGCAVALAIRPTEVAVASVWITVRYELNAWEAPNWDSIGNPRCLDVFELCISNGNYITIAIGDPSVL